MSVRSPRTSIAQTTSSGTSTLASQILWQVFFGDLLDEIRLVAFTEDGDFGYGDFVQPRLDE
jgi:hypothetical protein